MIYTDKNRGVIQNPDRVRQIIEFKNLKFGKMTPMDVDGLLEYHGIAYIFYEYKLDGALMPDGQRKALERLADDCQKAGKHSTVFLCEHQDENPANIVDAGSAIVKRIYYKNKWTDDFPRRTVREWTEKFIKFAEKEVANELVRKRNDCRQLGTNV